MEQWDYIKGYENLYKINRQGDIYSCIYGKGMKIQYDECGYMYVNLTKEGSKHKIRIHRLLALQYIPNPDNLPEVDHIDRVRTNNTLENLRWATRLMNARNKSTSLDLLTPEQLKERDDNLREYKRVWAYNKAREQGKQKKDEMNKSKDPEYIRNNARQRWANKTEEEKQARREYQKQWRLNHPLSEEEKEKARQRSAKQRMDKILNKNVI